MKRLILLFTVFVGLSACQEENVIPYTGGSYIYFNKSYGDDSEYDKTLITTQNLFMPGTVTEADTVWFRVHIRGVLADTAREVKFRCLENSDLPGNALPAEPGKHFVAFDDAQIRQQMVIPADSTWADIPVVILPDPEAEANTRLCLDFELATNEYFTVTEYRRLGRVMINR